MRYTRYNYKKKNPRFIIWLFFVVSLGVVLGVCIFNLFLIQFRIPVTSNELRDKDLGEESAFVKADGTKGYNINLIQCGLYASKENAEAIVRDMGTKFKPFIIDDNGKYKVIAGLYKDNDIKEVVDELNNSSINNFIVKCSFEPKSGESLIKKEILDGYFEIIDKISDTSIKSINLTEFKGWCNEMYKDIDNKDEDLLKLMERINNLPEEYTSENVKSDYEFLYEIVIKYKQ